MNRRRQARSSQRPNSESEEDNINHTQRAGHGAMMVDEPEPSPIAKARLMPHLAGDGNVSLSAYNETTLTEETIIGGFDSQSGNLRWPPPAPPNVS